MIGSSSIHETFLPSITSTELRKIIIQTKQMYGFLQRMELWASVDKHLCEVVDRLPTTGHHHMLYFPELETDPSGNDFTKALPRFREKGIVTVICGVYRQLLFFP